MDEPKKMHIIGNDDCCGECGKHYDECVKDNGCTGKAEPNPSICSKHQKRDPNCKLCGLSWEKAEPQAGGLEDVIESVIRSRTEKMGIDDVVFPTYSLKMVLKQRILDFVRAKGEGLKYRTHCKDCQEYTDYLCPFCRERQKGIDELIREIEK